ncbi:MAG: hypothetical protein QOE36_709 [Gaiellaceae bacterium]|nr:hypothetical protein [Gaiellaceae bacterium]
MTSWAEAAPADPTAVDQRFLASLRRAWRGRRLTPSEAPSGLYVPQLGDPGLTRKIAETDCFTTRHAVAASVRR